MGTGTPETFGQAALAARKKAELTLREAADQLELSPSYLSKIELERCPPPSAEIIQRMAKLYRVPWEELARFAKDRTAEIVGEEILKEPDLLSLYRCARGLEPNEIKRLIAQLLQQLPEDEREDWERKIKTEFPRLNNRRREMFAAQVQPRRWSKRGLRRRAREELADAGLSQPDYTPPTPIERIVERTPDVHVLPSDSLEMRCTHAGSPVVLGATKWDYDGKRKIIEVNERLYSRTDAITRYRLNYTLAHELWHAIEHLPLIEDRMRCNIGLFKTCVSLPSLRSRRRNWWEETSKPRRLTTSEDWQEWQCQYFAAEILMPYWHVVEEFEKRFEAKSIVAPAGIAPAEIANQLASNQAFAGSGINQPMHELYAVSRQAMAIRLLELKLVLENDPDEEGGVPE